MQETPVPHLTTAFSGPLCHIEEIVLNNIAVIEAWFRGQWQKTPAVPLLQKAGSGRYHPRVSDTIPFAERKHRLSHPRSCRPSAE